MTGDQVPVDLDKLFALLGRSEFTLHCTAHALARSEEVRARLEKAAEEIRAGLEKAAEVSSAERDRILSQNEDLKARLVALGEKYRALRADLYPPPDKVDIDADGLPCAMSPREPNQ